MEHPKTLQEAILYFADPDRCIAYLASSRWPDGVVVCPTCGRTDVAYVAKRRVWQCKSRHPKCQFSIKVGTIFEDSPIPLGKWLAAMWLIANCKNGISSWEIHRALKVTQKTAWFMMHRIRVVLAGESQEKMDGPIEVDESYVGGNPKNRHKSQRRSEILKMTEKRFGMKSRERRRTGRATEKTPVFGMLDRKTRQVRGKVLYSIRRDILMDAIVSNAQKGSTIYSDGLKEYEGLSKMEFVHQAVNHVNEYVRGEVHTNGIENFWSLLKRGLKGTYVAVEPFHLDRYLGEQIFRYNNRATKDNPLDDGDRFALAVSQILGRRLTYNELTGKTDARRPAEPF
jgi:transposase-like protein